MTRRSTLSLAITTILLTACNGDSNNTPSDNEDNNGDNPQDEIASQRLDASSHDSATYLNLKTGDTLALTAEEAAASTDWHLAFRRNDIKLNGGNSGPGDVAGAVGVAQSDFYTEDGSPNASVFLNATADSEKEHLLATLSAPDSWTSDAVVTEFGDAWYTYNRETHTVSANPDNGWLLRSAEGDSYARLRVNQFDYPAANGGAEFQFDFDVQPAGNSAFATSASFSGTLPSSGGEACFDFDSNASVDCDTASSWDIKVGVQERNLYLRSNSGVSGNGDAGVFGPMAWSEAKNYNSATTSPEGGDITGHYRADTTGGIFSDQSWYAYNLQGEHQLWPNYRVYLIDTDRTDEQAPVYALQVVSYYNDAGTSGHPKVRWVDVDFQDETES
ncbi:HmuY family protein [Halomonadaceae bacterium KBTZ08]